jgi:hypothetical protein
VALAEAEDVEAALGRDLTESETAQAPTLLDEASDLVIGYLGCDPTDEEADPTVPAAVTRVVARMVARVFSQSSEAAGSEATTSTAGPFSQTVRFAAGSTSGAPWLTVTDKVILRPYRCGGGMRTVSLSSDQTGRYRRYS